MKQRSTLCIILGAAAVLLIACVTLWAVTKPAKHSIPDAVVSEAPFDGKISEVDGVRFSVDQSAVTPISALVTIENTTGADLISSHVAAIEIHRFRDGQWYPVKFRTDRHAAGGIPAIAMLYPAGSPPYVFTLSWDAYRGELAPGHYRLVWSYWVGSYEDSVSLAAEFDIE